MRIGELARRADVTVRAVRYYESLGLIGAERGANGYREFDDGAVERVRNIRSLLASGLDGLSLAAVEDCLGSDLDRTMPCAEAIALYEQRLATVERRLRDLSTVRDELSRHLEQMRRHRQGTSAPA